MKKMDSQLKWQPVAAPKSNTKRRGNSGAKLTDQACFGDFLRTNPLHGGLRVLRDKLVVGVENSNPNQGWTTDTEKVLNNMGAQGSGLWKGTCGKDFQSRWACSKSDM